MTDITLYISYMGVSDGVFNFEDLCLKLSEVLEW